MQHFQLKGNFKTRYKFLAETNVVIHESDALQLMLIQKQYDGVCSGLKDK